MTEYIVHAIGPRTRNLNAPYYENIETEQSFVGPNAEADAYSYERKLMKRGYVTLVAIRRH